MRLSWIVVVAGAALGCSSEGTPPGGTAGDAGVFQDSGPILEGDSSADSPPPGCGNGIVDPSEACEPPDGDCCTGTCSWEPAGTPCSLGTCASDGVCAPLEADLHVGPGLDHETIQAAVDAASDGDVIAVHAGTYREEVTIATPNITIQGYDPKDPPIIDGADPSFSPTWIHVSGSVYKTAYDLPFPHTTCGDLQDGPDGSPLLTLYEDGEWLRGWGLTDPDDFYSGCPYDDVSDLDASTEPDAPSGRSLAVPGRFFYDESARELYVWSKDGDDPTNHDYQIPIQDDLVTVDAPGVTLRNLVIKHSYHRGIVVRESGDDARVARCFVLATGPWGIDARNASGLTIQKNIIQLLGYYERQDYPSVRHNRLKGALVEIRGYANAADCEVSENVVTGTYGIAVRGQHCRVHDNIVSRSQSLLIMPQVESSIPASGYDHDVRIFRNVLHDADYSSFANYNTLDATENQYYGNIYFYRNVIFAVRYVSKEGCHESPCPGTQDTFIYHNTFALGKQLLSHPYAYPVHKSTVYRNNIFHMRYNYMEMYWTYADKDPQKEWAYFPFDTGPDSDYNLMWRDDPNDWPQIARFRTTVDTTHSYAEGEFGLMQSETRLEVNSLEASPAFVNDDITTASVFTQQYDTFSTMDFRDIIAGGFGTMFASAFDELYHHFDVSAASPARDQGVALPAEWPDTEAITDGSPDLGAVEY